MNFSPFYIKIFCIEMFETILDWYKIKRDVNPMCLTISLMSKYNE